MIPLWDAAWSKGADKAALAKASEEDGTRRRKDRRWWWWGRRRSKSGQVSILPVLARAFGPAYFVAALLMFVLTFLYFARCLQTKTQKLFGKSWHACNLFPVYHGTCKQPKIICETSACL